MTKLKTSTAARFAVLALAAGGAATLSACEEHAYPQAAPREGTAAAPAGEEALAGAPSGYAPPSTRTPAYAPPPGPGATYGPPSDYAQNGYPTPGAYPPGYGHQSPDGAPPVIISMAPIPNPPERPHRYEPGWRHRLHHHRLWMRAYPAPAYAPLHAHHRPYHHHGWTPLPMAHHHLHARGPAAPVVHPAVRPAAPAHTPAAQLTKPAAPIHHKHHRPAAASSAAATSAAASGGSTNTTANTTASGSEADRYSALETSLREAFANGAQLQAPAHMEPNQPADITLTAPADFARTLQSEAGRQGLASALATVNLVATLTGEGYTIVPADPQSLPLAQGQATVFHWKATPTGAGHGALTATVKAVTPGANHTLELGSKSTGSGSATGRVVGIGLLALIALALLGWAAQRRRPTASGATRPRATHTNGTSNP